MKAREITSSLFSLLAHEEKGGKIRRDSSGHIYSPRMRSKRREKRVAPLMGEKNARMRRWLYFPSGSSDSSLSPSLLLDLQRNRVDPRISRRRDLENDVSGSSKPVDEIRMIDGVSGFTLDSLPRLHYTVAYTPIYDIPVPLRWMGRGWKEISKEKFWFFGNDILLSR